MASAFCQHFHRVANEQRSGCSLPFARFLGRPGKRTPHPVVCGTFPRKDANGHRSARIAAGWKTDGRFRSARGLTRVVGGVGMIAPRNAQKTASGCMPQRS
jgi:hypothetical protein